MALQIDQPDYFGNALQAFNAGRVMGQQQKIQSALQSYDPNNPTPTTNALIGVGALDQASALGNVQQQQMRQGAVRAAAQKASSGDFAGAAQAAAANGAPDLAGQYANIPAAQLQAAAPKIQAAVSIGQQLKQEIPTDPNNPQATIQARQQRLQQMAPQLQQMGFTQQDLAHEGLDLSDQGIDGFTQQAIASGLYKPPLMSVPYGSSLYNTATGQSVVQGHKLHITTIKREDGTMVPVAIDEATGQGFAVDASGQPLFNEPIFGGQGQQQTSAPSQPQNGTLAQRNNNPGNLRADGSQWQGMTGVDQNGFVQFASPQDGMRAASINLANQTKLHGINTLNDLITKYAPQSDNNDTQAYIATVAKQTGIGPNDKVDFSDPAIQQKVLPAIFGVEGRGTPARGGQTVAQPTRGQQGSQSLGQAMQPQMTASDNALVKSYADSLVLGGDPTHGSRNPRDQYLLRQAKQLALQQYGPDALNPANAAVFKANEGELNKLSAQRDTVYSYEETVNRNMDLLRQLAPKGVAGGLPVFNKWIQAGREATGDKDVTNFNTAVNSVVAEYAKVMSGSTGGGVTSDSARHEAHQIINNAQSLPQLMGALDIMQKEMQNRTQAMDDTITSRVQAMRTGGLPGSNTGQAKTETPSSSGGNQALTHPTSDVTDQQHAAFKNVFKPGAQYGSAQAPLIVRNERDWNNLKSGQYYIARDGSIGVKP